MLTFILSIGLMPTFCTRLTWTLFALSVAALIAHVTIGIDSISGWLRVDGLMLVMAAVITFVSGIIHSFARRYMAGSQHLSRFYGRLLTLTLVVLLVTAANHLVLFVAAWAVMGWLLADLIGTIRGWPQAQAAARRARWSFLGGSVLLAGALAVLAQFTGAHTIAGVLDTLATVPTWGVATAAGLLVATAMVQSALVPFHGWLLSSMTAPTPVSAFMHAGLVNAGGLLLARFAPVVAELPAVMLGIVVAGGLSALLAQGWMLVQTDVKRQLGCSTVAQMGFMVLQCGLGFFAAAIAHLILHGFYKAYLFLASGSVVEATRPQGESDSALTAVPWVVTGATALAGGIVFAWLTGKSLTTLDSGLLLTLVVVLAVLHAAQHVVRRAELAPGTRAIALPGVVLPALALYAIVYNGVATLTAGLPMQAAPAELSIVHVIVGGLFMLAYVAVERGWHQASPRLYVTLLNMSQPHPSTVLNRRDQYHAY
jgi:NAD(P)H-quinone oxidoreductase subunit 5